MSKLYGWGPGKEKITTLKKEPKTGITSLVIIEKFIKYSYSFNGVIIQEADLHPISHI